MLRALADAVLTADIADLLQTAAFRRIIDHVVIVEQAEFGIENIVQVPRERIACGARKFKEALLASARFGFAYLYFGIAVIYRRAFHRDELGILDRNIGKSNVARKRGQSSVLVTLCERDKQTDIFEVGRARLNSCRIGREYKLLAVGADSNSEIPRNICRNVVALCSDGRIR